MTNQQLAIGTVHAMLSDLRKALSSAPRALNVWQDITPIARNEWICWVISGKKAETRTEGRHASPLLLGRLYASLIEKMFGLVLG